MPWIPLKVFAVIPMGRLYRTGPFPQHLFRKTRGETRRPIGRNKSVKLPDEVGESHPRCRQGKHGHRHCERSSHICGLGTESYRSSDGRPDTPRPARQLGHAPCAARDRSPSAAGESIGCVCGCSFRAALLGRFSPATLPGLQRTQNEPADELAKERSLKAGHTAPGQSTRAKRMLLTAASFIDLHSSSMKPSFVDKSCAYCG